MIKIIFFDIDGTLRPFETGRIPDSAKLAVRRAQRAGILCAIATGRHWMEIYGERLIEELFFDAYVTLDGEFCYLLPHAPRSTAQSPLRDPSFRFDLRAEERLAPEMDPRLGDIVQKIPLPTEQVMAVLRLAERERFPVLIQEERRIYANLVNEELLRCLYEIRNDIVPPVLPIREAAENPVYMLIPILSYEESLKIPPLIPDCQLVRWSDGRSFDLTKKGINKSSGIDAVLRHLRLSRSEAAAIGDGWNDIDMLSRVGLGIAMGNEKPECREAADHVCPPILEDGLAHAVDWILQRNREEGVRRKG